MYFSSTPSVERGYVLSSVVRWYFSFTSSGTLVYFVIFIVSGTSMYISLIPSVGRWYCYRQWYVDVFLFNTFSGTRVCVIISGTVVFLFHLQWNVGVFCYLHRQWYVDVHLFNTFSGTLVLLSSVVRRCISLQHLQWNAGMCYHQWYGGISLSPPVERWCILLSSSSV